MDSTTKVEKYLADLRTPASSSASSSSNTRLKGVRGPGQTGTDPLQFVSTKGATELSERAKEIVSITDQQRRSREKQINEMPAIYQTDETESWQEDLDTWRRRRRNKTSTDEVSPANETTRQTKDSKERILTICSPNSVTEENNDSGIENRTNSHSPSTSLDFSPRSTVLSPSLQSPLSVQESGKTSALSKSSSHLDQVLIPLNQKVLRPEREESPDYPPPPAHLRESREDTVAEEFDSGDFVSPTKAHISASFQAPPEHRPENILEKLVKEQQQKQKETNVELVVELNREQKAQVTATKYSRAPQYKPTHNDYSSRKSVDSYHKYTGFQPLSHSISIPNMNTAKMPTTVYHTVDIPFDDTTATYQPVRKDKDGFVSILIEMGGQPAHKGFGFTIANEKRQYVVDSVIIGTPADRYGLLIGDRIISINGESLDEKYQSEVNRILHETARNGEIHLQIQRKQVKPLSTSNPNLSVYKTTTTTQKFEETRKVFNNTSGRPVDSYAEFKRKHTRNAREIPVTRDYNSLPRSSSTSSTERREGQIYGRLNGSRSSSIRSINDSDYKVTSLHEKSGPGKLTDFVPEVERDQDSEKRGYGSRNSNEETRTIRNYEVKSDYSNYVSGTRTYAAPIKSSTLPRKSHYQDVQLADDDTVPGKSFLESRDWRDVINQQRQPTPGERIHENEKIQQVRESMTNLPAIIGRKHEEARKLQRDMTDYSYNPKDSYARQEYSVLERKYDLPTENYSAPPVASKRYDMPPVDIYDKYAPVPPVPLKRYDSPPSERYVTPPTSVTSSIYERKEREMNEFKSQALREQKDSREEIKTTREEKRTSQSEQKDKYRRKEEKFEKKEEIVREPENQTVVAVSGKHKCAHCGEELGKGAAMIVESLNLFYHLKCFKCYVCKTALGSGVTGADVRVREGHLHCQSCYSNDKVQLSKV